MNPSIILGISSRYLSLYRSSPIRIVELIFWPIVDLLVWGFLALWLAKADAAPGVNAAAFLIGAMILWDALFRSQQGVAISFLEDVWTRNLLNVFAAPVRTSEYLGAMFLVGALRVAFTTTLLTLIALFGYHFNLFELKLALIPAYANLLIFGWSLGIVSMSLILRFGHGAESLAWAVPFVLQPLVCVFYPLSALPNGLQPVAQALPATHVFESMRATLTNIPSQGSLLTALALNIFYLALASLLLSRTLAAARSKGFLTKVTSS
ncbi:MAG: ABC transporter permease [Verrucomicrobiota bacterium]